MDTTEKFLESLALDGYGFRSQMMSLGSFFNIVVAGAMGFLVLLVYALNSGRSGRDKNLSMIIPVLSILMAVVMRIQGAQAVLFFGIFGILSIIRFRSDLTDQKGITFILFAVIEGLLVGVNAYLLGILAWIVVTGAIFLAKKAFNKRTIIHLDIKTSGDPSKTREAMEAWLCERKIDHAFLGSRLSQGRSGKAKEYASKGKLAFALYPRRESGFEAEIPQLSEKIRELGCEMELKTPGE